MALGSRCKITPYMAFLCAVNAILAVYSVSFTHMRPEVAQAKRTTKKAIGLLYIDLARAKSVAPVNELKNLNQTINLESTNL